MQLVCQHWNALTVRIAGVNKKVSDAPRHHSLGWINAGLLLLFLSVYSLHLAISDNLNVLWTLPAILMIIFRKRNFHNYLKLAYLIIIVLFISLQNIIPQAISFTFIPWMILLVVIILLDIKAINRMVFRKKESLT